MPFAKTLRQPVTVRTEQPDRSGQLHHLLTQVIRGVRITGWTQVPLRYGQGPGLGDVFAYPSDPGSDSDLVRFEGTRTAQALEQLLQGRFRYYE